MFDSGNPYFKQVQLLVSIMPFVQRQSNFALKGGTAINLFIRNLPRLSVDIDLVYMRVNARNTALAEIKSGLQSISRDIESSGIARVTANFASSKLTVSGKGAQVKVEVSQMLRGHLLPVKEKSVCSAIQENVGSADLQLLNSNEIFAGKLCAALDRQHPRDLFDVKFLLENEGINSELVDAFIIYLISSSRPISELLNPKLKDIQEAFTNHFEGMTAEPVTCLELEEAREKMISEIKTNLSEDHKNFLINFKKGEADWGDSAFPEAKNLPSILYKLYNLDRMSTHKRRQAIEKLERVL